MPAIIMVHDKILSQIINEDIDSILDINQFGGRQGLDTTSAKTLINYKATEEDMNKILLIDLRKAFDTVDRKIYNLGKDFLKFQQEEIEKLKEFM